MEEIYANIDIASPKKTGPRSPERSFYAVGLLGLGLLCLSLLAGLIGLGVHYHNVELGWAVDRASLTKERDQLSTNLTGVTKERDQLSTNLTGMTKERDGLQKRTCPAGWRMFGCSSCYLLSSEKRSWEISRQDCLRRGADLVVINSLEEQIFLTTLPSGPTPIWIGLSDREKEGTWKWVDGTPLTLTFWIKPQQPDNGGGGITQYGVEDCVEFHSGRRGDYWNDMTCATAQNWICEKEA